MVIGKEGKDIEATRLELEKMTGRKVRLNIVEGGLHEDGHGGADVLAADEIGDDLHLAGGDAEVFQISLCFHFLLTSSFVTC